MLPSRSYEAPISLYTVYADEFTVLMKLSVLLLQAKEFANTDIKLRKWQAYRLVKRCLDGEAAPQETSSSYLPYGGELSDEHRKSLIGAYELFDRLGAQVMHFQGCTLGGDCA